MFSKYVFMFFLCFWVHYADTICQSEKNNWPGHIGVSVLKKTHTKHCCVFFNIKLLHFHVCMSWRASGQFDWD